MTEIQTEHRVPSSRKRGTFYISSSLGSTSESPKLSPRKKKKVRRKRRAVPKVAWTEKDVSTTETDDSVIQQTVEKHKPQKKGTAFKETAVDKNESSVSSGSKYDQIREEELCQIIKRSKVLLEKLLEDLINLILQKERMSFLDSNFRTHHKWLFDRLWKEAEEIHWHITEDKFKGLHWVLYSDLCNLQLQLQVFCTTLLERKDPVFGDFVALRFRRYMVKMPSPWKQIKSKVAKPPRVSSRQRTSSHRVSREKVTLRKVTVKNPETPKVEDFPTHDLGIQVDEQQEKNEEKCELLLNQFLTKIIPMVFFRAHTDCSQENFTALYQKLHDRLWELCKSYNFKTKTVNIDRLCKKAMKELRKRVCQPEYFLLKGFNLQDPVSEEVFLHVFEKHMLTEDSKVVKFFCSVAKFLARPFRQTVFDPEGCLL